MFEEIFLLALGSASRLKFYIENDVNLANYVKLNYNSYLKLLRVLPGYKTIVKEAEAISHSQILDILRHKRPDLYKVIMTREGIKWLLRQNFNDFLKVAEGEQSG